VAATKRILGTAAAIRDGIAAISGLRVLGQPLLCIIAFASEEFHIYQLADEMKVKEIISLDFSSVYIEQSPKFVPALSWKDMQNLANSQICLKCIKSHFCGASF
jgi:hypothetical protein